MNNFPEIISRDIRPHLESSKALQKQFEVSSDETDMTLQNQGLSDPIADFRHQVMPGLIHRYKNRVLLTLNSNCPVHCRYCFRRNHLENKKLSQEADPAKIIDYLQNHEAIEEVILTGGDPFMLSTKALGEWFERLAPISSLKYLRFHTRVPLTLANRYDLELKNLFEKINQRFFTTIVLHSNHIDEFKAPDPDKLNCWSKLANQSLLQSVLLKDVNDSLTDLVNLMKISFERGFRPYYLHHPDPVKGGMHFYLSPEVGQKLHQSLHKVLPGWLIPRYIIDNPEIGSKRSAYTCQSH